MLQSEWSWCLIWLVSNLPTWKYLPRNYLIPGLFGNIQNREESFCKCLSHRKPAVYMSNSESLNWNIYFLFIFWLHYLRVLDVAFTGVVPSCQLLVEEAAEDVRALGHSGRGLVEEVSGSKKTDQQDQFPAKFFYTNQVKFSLLFENKLLTWGKNQWWHHWGTARCQGTAGPPLWQLSLLSTAEEETGSTLAEVEEERFKSDHYILTQGLNLIGCKNLLLHVS